jgi:hypothetical protein
MTTNKQTKFTPQWQTFNVVDGLISRNETGHFEGILDLGQGVAITFLCDPDGSHWTWLPDEPNFVPDESVGYGTARA